MSSHLPHEIDPTNDRDVAHGITEAPHTQDVRVALIRPWRIVRRSLVPAAAALGICLATTAAATDSAAHATSRSVNAAGRAPAQHPAPEIAALRAKGYTPVACTVRGTLMSNYHTGQSVIVGA